MPKRPISITLEESNLTWIQGVAARSGARSLSDAIDRLISEARTRTGPGHAAARSVVGTIDLEAADEALDGADAAIHALFDRSLRRPILVRESRPAYRAHARRRPPRG